MINPQKVEKAVEWYSKNRVIYQALARKVESIIREILESKSINYHSITSRAKTISSYKEKASKEKYKDPRSEIKDMAGVRVISYANSDAITISKIIKETFEIDPKYTVDKTEELGVDRVGYRSIHCVGTLGKERLKLPENKIFKDMCFEIQVRTILQHAWAEFEHDRNYKFRGILPKDIRRRVSIVAANLELADREFDSISEAIDMYARDVGKRSELGDLSIPINSTSLTAYMNKVFKPLVKQGVRPQLLFDDTIIEELQDMGIDTLEELNSIIPRDFNKIKSRYLLKEENFGSILRDILIIHDAEAYFKKAWREKWDGISKLTVSLYADYGIDFSKYVKIYGLDVLPPDFFEV